MKCKQRRIFRRWSAFLGAAVTSLSAGALSARPGAESGSVVTCATIEEITYCAENRWLLNQVTTPSGNVLAVGKGSNLYMEINQAGEIVYEDFVEYRTNVLEKDGALHQLSQWFSDVTRAFGFTCESSYGFHEVDGRLVLERSEQGCVPDDT